MSPQISRRDVLRGMAALPFLGFERWPLRIAPQEQQKQTMPNVLILVFDALSASNTSVYGYRRETMPNLARFAEQSTVYHAHYAGGNFTSPGVASLLTGTYPWSHRALHLHGTVSDEYAERNLFALLAPDRYYSTGYSHNLLVTSLLHQFGQYLDFFKKTRDLCLDGNLSEQLFPNDFDAAFSGEWFLLRTDESQPGSLTFSLFSRMLKMFRKNVLMREYGPLFPKGLPNMYNHRFVLEHALDWIRDQLQSLPRPFLAYYHLLPPHQPYATRHEFVDRFDDGWTPVAKARHFFSKGYSDEHLGQLRREYDEYVAYADAEFGRLYDSMAQAGILEDTYVVVTSDHGELFERGIWAHITPVLYEPVIRVPLLISKPGQRQREDVYTSTAAVDLLPTLLHVTGQPIPDWCEGRVLPTSAQDHVDSERSIYAVEAKSNPRNTPLTKGTVALIKGQYKLIHYFGYENYEDAYELYDLASDPEEMEDLYVSETTIAASLREELAEKLRQVNQQQTTGRG